MNLTAIRERFAVQAIRWAPKGLCSAAVGWGARASLPRPVRAPTYRAFSRLVGAQIEEAELPLDEYPSLSHFFARKLRTGARTVDQAASLTSPCDGVVAALGSVENDRMIQAKGKDYSLARLVVSREAANVLAGGSYATIYLSPKDYHRVHAPIAGELLGYDYVPGSHFPVNPLFSRSVDELMAQNERVVFHLRTSVGHVCLVMVAALGVSNIEVAHDQIETRFFRRAQQHKQVRFDRPIDVAQGDELGTFHLGSTTILVFEPNAVAFDDIRLGDTVRFGASIGTCSTGEAIASGTAMSSSKQSHPSETLG